MNKSRRGAPHVPHVGSLRLCPPLVITKDQASFAIDTLEKCLDILVKEPDRESSTSAAV